MRSERLSFARILPAVAVFLSGIARSAAARRPLLSEDARIASRIGFFVQIGAGNPAVEHRNGVFEATRSVFEGETGANDGGVLDEAERIGRIDGVRE